MDLANHLKVQALHYLFSLPVFARRALAGAAVTVDGRTLDLDMQLLLKLASLEQTPELSGQPDLLAISRQSMRDSACGVAGKTIPMQTRDVTLGLPTHLIPARLYVPSSGIGGLLLYFHGGGWVQGDLDSHDNLCRYLARISGVRVLSVNYRKAPEHPWPAAVEDAVAAYLDVIKRLPDFGVTRPLVAVGGDSAGANVATVLARKISHKGVLQPKAQLLIYPATDSSREHPSKATFADGFLLTLHNIRIYENLYIPTQEARLDPDVSPLLAHDIEKMAPAIVATAGFDPLRDEGDRYAERLQEAGVPVTKMDYPGLIHGFANALCAESARQAVTEMALALRELMLA